MSDFSDKFYTGHPRFYSFRALGSLQFPLEHSLGVAGFLEPNEMTLTCRPVYIILRVFLLGFGQFMIVVDRQWLTAE